ncbi:MAG: rubredoxin [Oscillospiraceae bacterium]
MKKYVCTVCGYEYDPRLASRMLVLRRNPVGNVPDDYVCPLCGVGKDLFEEA